MIALAPLGALLVAIVLLDAFETMVLPRRVTRRFRPARLFYRTVWTPWSALARRTNDVARRETLLGFFGPLSIILLFVSWAAALVFGFGLIHWAIGSHLTVDGHRANFGTDVYMSGTTFFTLGLGDVAPHGFAARAITVIEAGTGFGFLALVIGYLPVLYQAFSRREVSISLLDARAGSPPTAGELLRRYGGHGGMAALDGLLLEWERQAADLLESHLSYPILAYFRSQHDRQSWLAALTAILDTSALLLAGADAGSGNELRPPKLAFALVRHALIDLSQIFDREPLPPSVPRLDANDTARLNEVLRATGCPPIEGESQRRLAVLRESYEPYANALAEFLMFPLPPWVAAPDQLDDWQTPADGEGH